MNSSTALHSLETHDFVTRRELLELAIVWHSRRRGVLQFQLVLHAGWVAPRGTSDGQGYGPGRSARDRQGLRACRLLGIAAVYRGRNSNSAVEITRCVCMQKSEFLSRVRSSCLRLSPLSQPRKDLSLGSPVASY